MSPAPRGSGASFSRKKRAETPFPVAEVELARSAAAFEELAQDRRDWPVLQAVGIVPVERAAGRQLDGIPEPFVVGKDLQSVFRLADDGRGNGQGAKQGRVVSRRKVRRNSGFSLLPDSFSFRQAVDGSLHGHSFTPAEVNSELPPQSVIRLNLGYYCRLPELVRARESDRRHPARRASRSPPWRKIGFGARSPALPAERPAQTVDKAEGDRVRQPAIPIALERDALPSRELGQLGDAGRPASCGSRRRRRRHPRPRRPAGSPPPSRPP